MTTVKYCYEYNPPGECLTSRNRYYTTKAKYEYHPIALLLKKYKKLAFKEIQMVLDSSKTKDEISEERLRWLEDEIKTLELPKGSFRHYTDKSNIHRDLKKLEKQGIIEKVERGHYVYCPIETRKGVVFEEYFISRKIKSNGPNRRFGGYIEASIKLESKNYNTKSQFVNRFTYRGESLGGMTSLMYAVDRERSIVDKWFENYIPTFIMDTSNNLRPTIMCRVKEIIKEDRNSNESDKKSVTKHIERGNYNYYLDEDGWHISIPGGTDGENELVKRIISQIETPVVIAVLPPIPYEFERDTTL